MYDWPSTTSGALLASPSLAVFCQYLISRITTLKYLQVSVTSMSLITEFRLGELVREREREREREGGVLRGCLRAESRSSEVYLGFAEPWVFGGLGGLCSPAIGYCWGCRPCLLLSVRFQSAVLSPVTFLGASEWPPPPICSSPFGFYLFEASAEAASNFCCSRWGFSLETLSPATFPITGKSPELQFCFFRFRRGRLKCSRARFVCFSLSAVAGRCFYPDNGLSLLVSLLRLISMRGGYRRFVAIKSKSFDLAIVGTTEDVLKTSGNGRGRRISLLLPENVALWLLRASADFISLNPLIGAIKCDLREIGRENLQLSAINKDKRTFVIFPAGWNERDWAKIFDALTNILNLAFLGASGALRRPLHQVTLAHGVVPPPLPPPPPPSYCPKCGFTCGLECWLRSVPHVGATTPSRNVNEVVGELPLSQHMQMDRGKQRIVTDLGLRVSSSASTHVYTWCNSFGNKRNRVRESKGSSSEGRVAVCANWPPDALFVRETSSSSSDEAQIFDPTLNTIVSWTRDVVVSHQAHRGSVVLDIHPIINAHANEVVENLWEDKTEKEGKSIYDLGSSPNKPVVMSALVAVYWCCGTVRLLGSGNSLKHGDTQSVAYRAFYILNWIYRYFTEPRFTRWIACASGLVQTALYADFFYYYFVRKGSTTLYDHNRYGAWNSLGSSPPNYLLAGTGKRYSVSAF
ncbi:hypothetical protein Cgig2_029388 [Carnegiea gigantea]|uniref:Uncharacterized protein n=1 Tax=Carnegiea gigantea TaxID=171969 RepID=A0A9Q1KSD4_9CARY|nr:hypothetical protein Cgig2_029388 [Carnegiea gigantea]